MYALHVYLYCMNALPAGMSMGASPAANLSPGTDTDTDTDAGPRRRVGGQEGGLEGVGGRGEANACALEANPCAILGLQVLL